MKAVTICTDGVKPLCGFTGDAVLLAPCGATAEHGGQAPSDGGMTDKTTGSNTRTMMKTVTIYTDGIKTAMRFYR